MRSLRAGVIVAAAIVLWSGLPAAAMPGATLGATYAAQPPASAGAGTSIQLPVTLSNSGTEPWTAAGATPVHLSYHWYDPAGAVAVWDGARTALAADVAPGGSATVTATIALPAQPATYLLRLALVKEGVAWLAPSAPYPVQAKPAYQATFGAVSLPAFVAGGTYAIAVPVINSGTVAWNAAGANLTDLAYHWYDGSGNTVVWDGVRTALTADLAPGAAATVSARVTAPAAAGPYTLSFDLVREGVSWFGFLGGTTPLRTATTVAAATYAVSYTIAASTNVFLGESRTLPVTVINSGNVPWNAAGANPIDVAYHIIDASGGVVVWDGARTAIGTDLLPGQARTLNVGYTAPGAIGTYTLAIDTVREGIAWFSGLGSPAANAPLVVTSGFNGGYDQTITPTLATIGAVLQLSVHVTNYGARAWPAAGPNPVHLSYHVFTSAGAVIIWDGLRANLPNDLGVGQGAVVPISVALPDVVGSYTLSWDLVQEGVAWFSGLGVTRLSEPVSVQPGVTFYGKGFGHGVGLSQYGAQGYATGAAGPALTGEQIVAHYYAGTTLIVVDAATNSRGPMRVLLSAPSSSGSASCGQPYLLTWLNNVRSPGGFTVVNEALGNVVVGVAGPNATFQIAARNGGVQVWDQTGPTLKYSGSGPVTLVPSDPLQPITIQEKGEFVHGKIQFKNDGGNNLRVVNFVGYDDYVKGVIPKEMPAGWHIEAYKAQALAARSYGFTSYAPNRDYDVRDDQADQCYGGATVETSASIAAVNATAGKVITYNGAAIRAYFSSSSGGYTVGVGCWNTGTTCKPNDPFLVPVPDPADLAVQVPTPNKHASWQVTFSSDQIRSALINYKGIDIGALLSVDVSNQAPAGVGHVVSVKFRGSAASLDVPADAFLRTYLGLKSTMVRLSPF